MLYTILFFILTYFILAHSDISLYYAFHGFSLWYSKMIPSLLPFMILSGIMIRMNLTESFVKIIHPLFKRIFHCNPNVTYGIIIGFLCGFPMGAKTAADLLGSNKINQKEAEFLLAFCNNIGPVYYCTFIIPLLEIKRPLLFLFGMYALPFLYGIILRYTTFKNTFSNMIIAPNNHVQVITPKLLNAVDESIKSGLGSIYTLCGYMILFNLLNILPHFLLPKLHIYIAPLLEITGGLSMLGLKMKYYSLCILPFGGLSCIAQTYSMISKTNLSIRTYLFHKVVLTVGTVLYFLIINVLFPLSLV